MKYLNRFWKKFDSCGNLSSIINFRSVLFIVLLPAVPSFAQPQVLNFRQLEQFLPQGNFGNYEAEQPTGETSTMMGFSTSWAQVEHRSPADSSAVFSRITDLLNIPSYLSMIPSLNGDSVRSTPAGYEKRISYKGLNVIETYDSITHQAKLETFFANRFLLEITGAGINNPSILYELLDKVNLDGLRELGKNENK